MEAVMSDLTDLGHTFAAQGRILLVRAQRFHSGWTLASAHS